MRKDSCEDSFIVFICCLCWFSLPHTPSTLSLRTCLGPASLIKVWNPPQPFVWASRCLGGCLLFSLTHVNKACTSCSPFDGLVSLTLGRTAARGASFVLHSWFFSPEVQKLSERAEIENKQTQSLWSQNLSLMFHVNNLPFSNIKNHSWVSDGWSLKFRPRTN